MHPTAHGSTTAPPDPKQSTPARLGSAAAGVVAGLLGLAVAELAGALLHARLSAVQAVGETVIAITPGSVAERAVKAVGTADKPLLVGGVLVGLLLACAAGGLLGAWRRGAGILVLGALAVLAALAASTRDAGLPAIVPAAVGGVAAIATFSWLLPRATALRPATRGTADPTRRRLLLAGGEVLVVAGLLGGLAELAGRGRRTLERLRAGIDLRLPSPVTPQGAEVGVQGVASWITPVGDFYRIDTALAPPLIQPADWRLRIHGLVDRELTLTYADLLDRGLRSAWVTLCCVSNPVGGNLISNARWAGVRIADLLGEVGVQDGADALLSTSSDGWTSGTPLSVLTDGREALLAVAMNGEPLSVEHGFPVRMVVPGLYGYVSATKWVVDWEVTRFADFDAYWTRRGWSPQGPVKISSRIDAPRAGAGLTAGPVRVAGVAWAQHTGIAGVQVRIDDGDWMRATLAAEPSIDSWVQWVFEWPAVPGDHMLAVRAVDATGVPQTGELADTVPNGATGWHTINVSVA